MTTVLTRPLGDARHLAVLGLSAVVLFLGLFFSIQAGLLLLAGTWVAFLTWRYPWPAFLLLIAVAPFLLILKATVVLGPLTILKDVVIVALLARTFRPRDIQHIPVHLFVPLVALVGWVALAFVRADAHVLGFLRLRDLLLYLFLLPIALQLVVTRERLRAFLRVFFATGAVILVLGAVQWVAVPDSMVLRFDATRQAWVPRLSSILAHPNHLGGFLLLLVPLAAAITVTHGVPIGLRISGGGLTAAGLVATLATYSRSAWIAVVVSLAAGGFLWALRTRARPVGAGIAAFLILLGALAAVPAARERIRALVSPAYQSNRTRLDIVAGSLVSVSNVGAVIGEGLGDTVTLLGRTADLSLFEVVAASAREAALAKARTFVDNAVIKTWVEQGTVGLVLVLWIAVRLFREAVRVGQSAAWPEARGIALAFSAILVGLAAFWWFLDVPDMFPLNMYFWTFAGLILGSTKGRRSSSSFLA